MFSSEQKLTGGISFTVQFPMATDKKKDCTRFIKKFEILTECSTALHNHS
jgi:hypothetical protein